MAHDGFVDGPNRDNETETETGFETGFDAGPATGPRTGKSGIPRRRMRRRTFWLLSVLALLAAAVGGTYTGMALHASQDPGPDGPVWKTNDTAAIARAFVAGHTVEGTITAVVILGRSNYPGRWTAAWATSDGSRCVAQLAARSPQEVVTDAPACFAPGFFLSRDSPLLVLNAGFLSSDERYSAGDRSVDMVGFVRGASKIEATWNGAPAPVRVASLGLSDDPGLSAFVVQAPSAKGVPVPQYVITAFDASGAVIKRIADIYRVQG